MTFWADLWSFLTAVGTVAMAGATYCIIRQGRRQRQDTQLQHQDRFKPICVLTPYEGVDPWNRRDRLIEKFDPSSDNPSFGTLGVKCALQNVGGGPALKLRIKFMFLDMDGWSTEPWELSPLGAGESRGGKDALLLVPIRIDDHFNAADFSLVVGKPWEIWLDYEDIFGRRFRAVHHKRPLQLEKQTPIPGSITGMMYAPPQPWVTFIDLS
jgi:hypothetical protein